MTRERLENRLVCPACGAGNFKNLSGHIMSHGMDVDEFRKKYDYHGPIIEPSHARLMAARSNALWASPETRARRILGIKNSYTEELKKIRSEDASTQWADLSIRHKREEALSEALFGKSSPFKGYLTSQRSILRQKLYERAGSKCEECGVSEEDEYRQTGRRLNLHHKNYDRTIPELEDVELLCANCHQTNRHGDGHSRERLPMVANAVGQLLKALRVDLTDENFIETPRRVAQFLLDHFVDGDEFEEQLEACSAAVFPSEYDGMVVQSISAVGMCPHHLLPVLYNGSVGYVPDQHTIGLSKLSRMAELCLKMPILQEFGTLLLADTLCDILKTQHVAVWLRGQHMCMAIRGVKAKDSFTISSELRGMFKDDPSARSEFLSFARLQIGMQNE